MNIIQVRCPKCGNTLQINENLKVVNCNYCGVQFLNENVPKKSNEVNNTGNQYYEGLGLAEAISRLVEPLQKKKQLEFEINQLRIELDKANKMAKKDKTFCNVLWIISVVLLFGLLCLFGVDLISKINENTDIYDILYRLGVDVIIAVPILSGPVIIYVDSYKSYKKNSGTIQTNPVLISQKETMIYTCDEELKSLGFESIPVEYRSDKILMYFCEVLSNKQANSLQNCINLYNINKNLNKDLQPQTDNNQPSVRCPRCNNNNVSIINEYATRGSDYSVGKGICGTLCFGPIGILCGMTGGKKTVNTHFYICRNCKYKWRL